MEETANETNETNGNNEPLAGGAAGCEDTSPLVDGSGAPARCAEDTGAPEAYEGFSIPEDAPNVAADPGVMSGFGELAKGMNLTQAQAQQLIDFGAKAMHKAIGDGMEAIRAQMEEVKRKWHFESSADAALMADVPMAQRVVQRFRSDEFIGMLNETGVGSHKAMIRFLAEIGKVIGEAPIMNAGGSAPMAGGDAAAMAKSVYGERM